MGYYLLDHRNPHGDNFYTSRRGKILAIVTHITAGLEDLDTVDDHSAENTARYAATTDRSVSWHLGSDTDTGFHLLPAEYVAFHVRNYNTHTIGHEISKKHADWRTMSKEWIEDTLREAAELAAPVAKRWGIPARHANKAELDREIARGSAGQPVGFIDHWQLDPTRRVDPGKVDSTDTFPWADYLRRIQSINNPAPATPAKDEDDMMFIITPNGEGGAYRTRIVAPPLVWVPTAKELKDAKAVGVKVLPTSHANATSIVEQCNQVLTDDDVVGAIEAADVDG